MSTSPFLRINQLTKSYTQGQFRKKIVFQLQADFNIDKSAIIGMLGANGTGKATLMA